MPGTKLAGNHKRVPGRRFDYSYSYDCGHSHRYSVVADNCYTVGYYKIHVVDYNFGCIHHNYVYENVYVHVYVYFGDAFYNYDVVNKRNRVYRNDVIEHIGDDFFQPGL